MGKLKHGLGSGELSQLREQNMEVREREAVLSHSPPLSEKSMSGVVDDFNP